MISVLIDRKLEQYERKIRYSVDFIFSTLGYKYRFVKQLSDLEERDMLFFYSLIEPTNDELLAVGPQRLMFVCPVEIEQAGRFNIYDPGTQKRSRLREIVREIQLYKAAPVIAGRPFQHPLMVQSTGQQTTGRFGFDLIGNVFYHLAGCEALSADAGDGQESMFAAWSHLPVVNMLLWLLDQFLQESMKPVQGYLARRALWPHGEPMAVAITHKVCHLQKWRMGTLMKSFVKDILWLFTFRWKRWAGSLMGKCRFLLTNWEPYWNFDTIFAQQARHKLRSTFFFGVQSDDPQDIDYHPEDPDLRAVTGEIERSGCEMALLASSRSHKDESSLRSQKARFSEQWSTRRPGVRQNGCHHHRTVTPDLHQKVKLAYDSSRGWPQRNGFLDGIAFPWYPYAWEVDDANRYEALEFGLHFSDRSLRLSPWRNVPPEQAQRIVKNLLQTVEPTQGLLTFEFDVAHFDEIPYLKRLFAYLTDLLNQRNIHVDTLHNLWRWWRRRNRVEILEGAGEILLQFPDDLPAFTLDIAGSLKILAVEGAQYSLQPGRVTFLDVKAGTSARVRLHAVLGQPTQEEATHG
ncbi:MAG: hypothetical protein K8R90_00840 [Candidatus Cloacimonetes bacterium]|nr:hypothetical protein [Candidatus Cloacimonadota bacterium]